MCSRRCYDLFHILITYHLPEPVRAEKQDVMGSQGYYKSIHLDGSTFTQTSVDLIALRMCIDVVRCYHTTFYHTCNYRMIACNRAQSLRFAIEIGATIPHIDDIGS